MSRYGLAVLLVSLVMLTGGTAEAEDRPDNIRPWVPPVDIRSRVMEGLQTTPPPRAYEDRSAGRRLPTVEQRNTQIAPRSAAPSVGRTFEDRSGRSTRAQRDSHLSSQYRSDIIGARQRLERESRFDGGSNRRLERDRGSSRRTFDRLQRLRREETRTRR